MLMLNPATTDRVLIADQLFAALRTGQARSEAAAALGVTDGQARRMISSFSRVRRDRLVRL